MDIANAIRNAVLAICGCMFAILGLGSLIVYGSDATRVWAIIACLLACFSQFIGQDPRRRVQTLSIAFAYLAFGAVIVALAFLAIQ